MKKLIINLIMVILFLLPIVNADVRTDLLVNAFIYQSYETNTTLDDSSNGYLARELCDPTCPTKDTTEFFVGSASAEFTGDDDGGLNFSSQWTDQTKDVWNLTIMFWSKMGTGASAARNYLGTRTNFGTADDYWLMQYNDITSHPSENEIQAFAGEDDGTARSTSAEFTDASLTNEAWYHACATYNYTGTTMTVNLYVNGTLSATGSTTWDPGARDFTATPYTDGLIVGNTPLHVDTGANVGYLGNLDEVYVGTFAGDQNHCQYGFDEGVAGRALVDNTSITFTAKDKYTSVTLNNFNINVKNSTTNINFTTESGLINLNDSFGGLMNFTITSTNYISNFTQIDVSSVDSFTFNLTKLNTLILNVYSELDGIQGSKLPNSTLELISDTFSSNYSITSGTLNLGNLSSDNYRLTVKKSGYRDRNYFVDFRTVSFLETNAYLLDTNNGTDVTFTAVDNAGNNLENALITLKRGYIQSDSSFSYISVAQEKTDFNGQAVIDVDFDDAYYQIFASYNNSETNTVGSKIFSTTIQLALDLFGDPFSNSDILQNTVSNISFNNNTQNFIYTFNNNDGNTLIATLNVYKQTPSDSSLVCTTTATSSSGSLLCNVDTAVDPGTYKAEAFVNTQTDKGEVLDRIIYFSNDFKSDFTNLIGTQGMFYTVILSGSLAGLMAFNPAVAIIGFLVGLAAMAFLGMSYLSFGAYLVIALIGGFVAYKIRA